MRGRIPGLLALLACAAAAACAAPERMAAPPVAQLAAPPGHGESVRLIGADPRILADGAAAIERIRAAAAAGDGVVDVLALSGGGAGGAFSAGALVGLTEAGARPEFEVVTGVSTGALVAPFAFLGPDWDPQLVDGYRGDNAADLLQPRGLGVLFRPSLYRGGPLRRLIDPYITDALVEAVGAEAAKGRYLLVATTNLDTQQTVIWDMTRLAAEGGAGARELFRDILVASASIPGVFPPVMLEVEQDGARYQEMHVDGGVTAAFFVAPELWMIHPDSNAKLPGARVWVVINDQLQARPETTERSTMEVVTRSLLAVSRAMARAALERDVSLAARDSADYRFTFIPTSFDYDGSLEFDTGRRRALFDFAAACAAQGRLWVEAAALAETIRRSDALARSAGADAAPDCPAAP